MNNGLVDSVGEGEDGKNWEIRINIYMLSSVQLLSRVHLFVTTWTAARQASLSINNFWSLLKLMSIESVMIFGDWDLGTGVDKKKHAGDASLE